MNYKELVSVVLTVFESNKVPTAFKLLLYFSVISVLLSLSGFPVVDYVENAHQALMRDAPRLYGAFTGFWVGITVAQMLRPALLEAVKNSVLLFTGGREEGSKILVKPEKLDDYRWALRAVSWVMIGLIVALVYMGISWLTEAFVADGRGE